MVFQLCKRDNTLIYIQLYFPKSALILTSFIISVMFPWLGLGAASG